MNLFDKADELVLGDRQDAYGHPTLNHGCTAALWRAYLERKFGITVPVDAEDVCWLNILQKVSRQANERRDDNLVDVAGYLRNIELLVEEVDEPVLLGFPLWQEPDPGTRFPEPHSEQ